MLAITSLKAYWNVKAPKISKFYHAVTFHGQLLNLIGPTEPLPELPQRFMSI